MRGKHKTTAATTGGAYYRFREPDENVRDDLASLVADDLLGPLAASRLRGLLEEAREILERYG